MAKHDPVRTRHTTPPTAEDIADLAEHALAEIPEALRRHVAGVGISVEELADDATLKAMEIANPWDLTGLYHGTPLGQRSVLDVVRGPDLIFLYRQPILLEWVETGDDLGQLVRTVLIHEIAHHFGFSDEEIERLEES
jgi:predicted Zn-dependent protease with MMP-like domain